MFLFPDRPVLPSLAPQPTSAYCPTMEHRIVHVENNHFCGWPANNGLWQWDGQEILVGFIRGRYKACEEAHSIGTSYESLLARSINGGESWHVTKPMDFMHNGTSTSQPRDAFCALRVAATTAPRSPTVRSTAPMTGGRPGTAPGHSVIFPKTPLCWARK